jgi:hypothetical protein
MIRGKNIKYNLKVRSLCNSIDQSNIENELKELRQKYILYSEDEVFISEFKKEPILVYVYTNKYKQVKMTLNKELFNYTEKIFTIEYHLRGYNIITAYLRGEKDIDRCIKELIQYVKYGLASKLNHFLKKMLISINQGNNLNMYPILLESPYLLFLLKESIICDLIFDYYEKSFHTFSFYEKKGSFDNAVSVFLNIDKNTDIITKLNQSRSIYINILARKLGVYIKKFKGLNPLYNFNEFGCFLILYGIFWKLYDQKTLDIIFKKEAVSLQVSTFFLKQNDDTNINELINILQNNNYTITHPIIISEDLNLDNSSNIFLKYNNDNICVNLKFTNELMISNKIDVLIFLTKLLIQQQKISLNKTNHNLNKDGRKIIIESIKQSSKILSKINNITEQELLTSLNNIL